MVHTTAFYHDERCLWHTTGEEVLVIPLDGWLQPPAGGGHAESPETKRRFKALLDVSGLGTEDPFEELLAAQQPSHKTLEFQRDLVDEMAEVLV